MNGKTRFGVQNQVHKVLTVKLYTQAAILQVEPRRNGLEEDSFPLPFTRVARPLLKLVCHGEISVSSLAFSFGHGLAGE